MVARRRGNPPRLDAHPPPSSSPQQLPLAHVQRKRNVASLGERLAILLPQASLDGPCAPNVVLMPSLHSQRTPKTPQTAELSITASHETPEKLQKLSQKLTALLGREPSSYVAKSKLSSQELLWHNSAKVMAKADLMVDFVLEEILGDAVKRFDMMPSKVEAKSHLHCQVGSGADKSEAACPPEAAQDTTLSRMVQSAADRLLVFEHELRMTYGEGAAKSAWTKPVPRQKENVRRQTCDESDEEGLRVASWPAQRVLELERYRARFAHHCMAAREAGIQSGPGSRTATWVIWPYLADSIAMAVVESAIEEADNAMEEYVDRLIQDEVGGSGERTQQP